MIKHVRSLGLCLAVAAVASQAAPARAHFRLESPACLSNQGALGDPQKAPPCGESLVETDAVTTFRPGETITIKIQETIPHPGHYRVLLAPTRAQLPDDPPVTPGATPCGSTAINPNPTLPLLADGLLVHTTAFPGDGRQTMQVKLPDNMTCTNCVLQVVEFMSNHGLNVPGGCFYHHCATISIKAADDGGAGAQDLAGPRTDGGADLGASPPGPPAGGCSCNVGGGRADVGGLLVLGLAVLLGRRRRR